MNTLRNRFLGTSSLLFSPPGDPPSDGKKPVAEVVGDVQDTGDDAGEAGAEGAGNADAEGTETEADAESDEDPDGAGDDEDPDLADLPPEVRARARAAIDKRVAKETGWRDRQIDKLHAKRRSAEADAEAAGAIVARQPGAAKPGETLTETQIQERAKALATRMTAQERYDNAANEADAKGKTAYGDKWGTTLAKLPKLGGVEVTDMVDILATDQPHVVLFQLSDPEVYDRVMSLSPARRRNEFVKLSLKEAPKSRGTVAESKTPSSAPAPVTPISGGRRTAAQQTNLYDDKAADDAWYAERNKTRRKKFSNVE